MTSEDMMAKSKIFDFTQVVKIFGEMMRFTAIWSMITVGSKAHLKYDYLLLKI